MEVSFVFKEELKLCGSLKSPFFRASSRFFALRTS